MSRFSLIKICSSYHRKRLGGADQKKDEYLAAPMDRSASPGSLVCKREKDVNAGLDGDSLKGRLEGLPVVPSPTTLCVSPADGASSSFSSASSSSSIASDANFVAGRSVIIVVDISVVVGRQPMEAAAPPQPPPLRSSRFDRRFMASVRRRSIGWTHVAPPGGLRRRLRRSKTNRPTSGRMIVICGESGFVVVVRSADVATRRRPWQHRLAGEALKTPFDAIYWRYRSPNGLKPAIA